MTRQPMLRRMTLALVVLTLAAANGSPRWVAAGETAFTWRTAGVRGGIDDRLNNEDFGQAEAFATWSLPWSHRWSSGWSLTTALEASVGALWAAGDEAFIGTVGPGVALAPANGGVEFSLGFNPTWISRHVFGDTDLGGPIAFSTHVGVAVSVVRHLAIGYRFQHTSNANIYSSNPGIDVHMIEMAYRF